MVCALVRSDVAVVGGGPAGWAAAVSFAEIGFDTMLIDPNPASAWPNNYGAWRDELEDADEIAASIWPRAEVRLDEERVHVLDRAYIRVDNARLQAKLRRRAEAAGLRVNSASVATIEHDSSGSHLTNDDGDEIVATLVVDATGHRPRFIRPNIGRPPGVQIAYGVQAHLLEGRVPADRMVLMDFSSAHLAPSDRDPPTFLYSMPLGADQIFVEETSLVGRPPLDIDVCRRRLTERLHALGLRLGPAEHVEHCYIPMGGPLPSPQRMVAFGGSAAAVHPATGYMIANVLRAAPRLASAVWQARDRREPSHWSRAAWNSVWPDDRRRAWMLYRYGMEVLVTMGVSSTADFFDAFFKLPPHHWQAYLSGDVPSRAVASAMWLLFRRARPSLRWQLMTKGFSALMPAL